MIGTTAIVLVGAVILTVVFHRPSAKLPAGDDNADDVRPAELPTDDNADDVRYVNVGWVTGKDHRERMVVENGSANLVVLPRDSGPAQGELKRGTWLVYFCADWNQDAIVGVRIASALADSLRGTAKVAVQDFVEYKKLVKLYPGVPANWGGCPMLWVILSDGKVRGALGGLYSRREVVAFVREGLKKRKSRALKNARIWIRED